MSEWIKHDGIKRPVARECIVQVMMRDGTVHAPIPAGFWGEGEHDDSNWWHNPNVGIGVDIVEYKMVTK